MLAACHERLAPAGFSQYEVSAYATAGKQCRHNLNYWSFGDYVGMGAGAHGKLTFADRGEIVRTTQQREPRRYQAASPDGDRATRAVAAADLPFEFMMNALRLGGRFRDRAVRGAHRARVGRGERRIWTVWQPVGYLSSRVDMPGRPLGPALPQRNAGVAFTGKGWFGR